MSNLAVERANLFEKDNLEKDSRLVLIANQKRVDHQELSTLCISIELSLLLDYNNNGNINVQKTFEKIGACYSMSFINNNENKQL